ncbi:MAG: Hsp33 family molecular chaperone HslO [Fibrobacteres bacterium]|nr:Hsp33 family molecular chaperone HslO [Fibrobacterota bacterium]
MQDKVIRFIAREAELRGIIGWMPSTAALITKQHALSEAMGEQLSDTLMCASMLVQNIKSGALSLRLESQGIIGLMNVDATPDGFIRGMISKANVEDEAVSRSLKLPMLGHGILTIIKKLHPDKPAYQGVIEVEDTHVAPMVTAYLLQSEQIKSSTAAATIYKNGQLEKSAGFFVEALPKLKEEDLNKIEENIRKIGNFKTFLESVDSPEAILEPLLNGMTYDVTREVPVKFFCPCSEEKVMLALRAAGNNEIRSMIADGKGIETFCDYCRKRYLISVSLLNSLIS